MFRHYKSCGSWILGQTVLEEVWAGETHLGAGGLYMMWKEQKTDGCLCRGRQMGTGMQGARGKVLLSALIVPLGWESRTSSISSY